MKAFKVNNLITPYKAHAFIEAQGNTELIKEHITYDISATFWMIEDDKLVFNWECQDDNVNHEIELEVETENEIDYDLDCWGVELTSYLAVFSCIRIDKLTYYSIDDVKRDLGHEIGAKVKEYVDEKVQNVNDEL